MNKKLFIFMIIFAASITVKTAMAQSSRQDTTVCYGSNYTTTLGEVECAGTLIYLWEERKDANTPWTNASGINNLEEYEIEEATLSMHYRRIAKCESEDEVEDEDDAVTIETVIIDTVILVVLPPFKAGAIVEGHEIIYVNENIIPNIIESTVDAEGGNGKITYQWRKNGDSIPNTNLASYRPPLPQSQDYGKELIYTRYAKDDGKCAPEWVKSDGEWKLIVEAERPKLEFVNKITFACSNQEKDYEVTYYPNTEYEWEITTENGKIVSQDNSMVKVLWDRVTTASIGIIKVTATITATDPLKNNILKDSLLIAISSEATPKGEIVAKIDDSTKNAYILIYPDPGYKYKWYKNDVHEAKDTLQFYYREQGLTSGTYAVEIWEYNEYCACRKEITLNQTVVTESKLITVSPNPVRDGFFTVSFNREALKDNVSNFMLTIHSLTGLKVWELQVNSLDNLQVNKTMPAGFYFITLTAGKQHYTEKFIIK